MRCNLHHFFFCLQAYIEKEDSKKLKQKQRERMQPKMGKMDIDYQVLFLFSCLVYSNLVEWLGKIRIIGLQKCHLLSWWQILWLTFLVSFRFCMMHFLNIRRSQSWHHMVICIMKGKNLRYAIVFPVPPLYVHVCLSTSASASASAVASVSWLVMSLFTCSIAINVPWIMPIWPRLGFRVWLALNNLLSATEN